MWRGRLDCDLAAGQCAEFELPALRRDATGVSKWATALARPGLAPGLLSQSTGRLHSPRVPVIGCAMRTSFSTMEDGNA